MKNPSHEVYPSAPLRFVAFEARFSPVPFLETQEGRLAIYSKLQEHFPILQAAPQQPNPVGLVFEPVQQMRMMDRSRSVSATVTPATVSVEASRYEHFGSFVDLIENALDEITRVVTIPTLERVGLRYTDEIRVQGVNRPQDWNGYVESSLLGPLRLVEGLEPEEHQAQIAFRVHDNHLVRCRYGATEGWSVDPNGPLNVQNRGAGPYFLIDLDSFWTAPVTEFSEFSVDATIALLRELHEPLRKLFEASITEKLRDEVFRKGPEIDFARGETHGSN